MGRRLGCAVVAGLFGVLISPAPSTAAAPRFGSGPIVNARASEPVILTGAQIPAWSRSSAQGVAAAYPSGSLKTDGGDGTRSAHNGILTIPPDARTGVDPDQVAAYRWDGSSWGEIPVQVDQKYQYFLANGHSAFAFYSGTDQETTFAWNPTLHSVGEEAWKKVFGQTPDASGQCRARYEAGGPAGDAELLAAEQPANGQPWGAVSPNPNSNPLFQVPADDYRQAMPDPIKTFNDDDEIVFMAGDAGGQAPPAQAPPVGAGNGQTVTIVDPTSGTTGFVYLFIKPGGSSFNASNGYVQMTRDANADEWIDRYSFSETDPNKLGTSNGDYGPNLPGNVCRTVSDNDANPHITTPDGQPRPSSDRAPRDGMTVTTPTYRVYESGRWMVRQFSVTQPGTTYNYGPNLISRWKGRAFQQSPNSSISVVGFEDEQVNWEMNSAVLGWKAGPVRAIREIWGADSGTNVTKTEIYYRDADVFHYHVRVHPIPPDGLYTSWDYRLGAVSTYYDKLKPAGVPIDGLNDNVGHVDAVPVSGQPAFLDTCDPAFNVCSAVDNPEEVAGPNGGLVYVAEIVGPTTVLHPAVVPYYRDDACLDDGTGDGNGGPGGPPPRPWPGNASTDQVVKDGYVAYWKAHGAPSTLTYADLACNPADINPADPQWKKTPFQGAIGQHGLHFFFTADSDNAFAPVAIDEIDAQQWRYSIPMSQATNVSDTYGNNVVVPLRAVVTLYGTTPTATAPEVPVPALLLLAAMPAVWFGMRLRRRGGW